MSDFSKLLQEYKNLYTAWDRFGMPGGVIMWHQGRGGHGYTTRPGTMVDINQCCEEGKYIGTSKPWLYYDKDDDSVTIYSVHYKSRSEVLLFEVHKSTFPKHELSDYARQHSMKLEVLLGRRPLENSKKKDVEVVVLCGKHSDFIKAGWEDEIQEDLRKKEREVATYRNGCTETRKRIVSSVSMIEQAYNSSAMGAVESYTHLRSGSESVLFSPSWDYTLYLHGVMWHKLERSIVDASWFMPFSEVGYDNLETDEQLFCFATAMFCRKTGIEPAVLDVERITWNCEIKNNHIGKYINNPRLNPDERPTTPLKPIFD